MFKIALFALFSLSFAAQAQSIVRVDYNHVDSYEIVTGKCTNAALAGAPADFNVSNTIKIKVWSEDPKFSKTYTYNKKEQGYGDCKWALDAADAAREALDETFFSFEKGDLEVKEMGASYVCYRKVLDLKLVTGTTTIKSYSFKNLYANCTEQYSNSEL